MTSGIMDESCEIQSDHNATNDGRVRSPSSKAYGIKGSDDILLTPRSRVRSLLAAESPSSSESSDDETNLLQPRARRGRAALLKKRLTLDSRTGPNEETSCSSYMEVRQKLLGNSTSYKFQSTNLENSRPTSSSPLNEVLSSHSNQMKNGRSSKKHDTQSSAASSTFQNQTRDRRHAVIEGSDSEDEGRAGSPFSFNPSTTQLIAPFSVENNREDLPPCSNSLDSTSTQASMDEDSETDLPNFEDLATFAQSKKMTKLVSKRNLEFQKQRKAELEIESRKSTVPETSTLEEIDLNISNDERLDRPIRQVAVTQTAG
ncbi:uncharacterized protein V1510DRAFT_138190 [Dipodascopsis tothii]|uniref:uncharacterized protein n=1 Tax=Dipodascopsis tothii TaxID=44089 RepID=UPI0034CF8158